MQALSYVFNLSLPKYWNRKIFCVSELHTHFNYMDIYFFIILKKI